MNSLIKLIQLKHFRLLLIGSLVSISCQVTTAVIAQAPAAVSPANSQDWVNLLPGETTGELTFYITRLFPSQ